MENRITVREAITEIEIAAFWEQLYNYYKRDIFPDSVDGEQNHFLGGEYRQHMEIIHKRPQDRCYYLLLIYKCRVSVPNSQLGLNPLIV